MPEGERFLAKPYGSRELALAVREAIDAHAAIAKPGDQGG
jgi:hypothetical protein